MAFMDIGAKGILKDFEKFLRMPEATPTGKRLTTKIGKAFSSLAMVIPLTFVAQ